MQNFSHKKIRKKIRKKSQSPICYKDHSKSVIKLKLYWFQANGVGSSVCNVFTTYYQEISTPFMLIIPLEEVLMHKMLLPTVQHTLHADHPTGRGADA